MTYPIIQPNQADRDLVKAILSTSSNERAAEIVARHRLALPADPVQSGQEEEVADAVHEELWKVDAEVAMLRSIADRLVDQQDEPWPDGSESDRLHYWRDKAIHASRDIHSALSGTAPATTGGE